MNALWRNCCWVHNFPTSPSFLSKTQPSCTTGLRLAQKYVKQRNWQMFNVDKCHVCWIKKAAKTVNWKAFVSFSVTLVAGVSPPSCSETTSIPTLESLKKHAISGLRYPLPIKARRKMRAVHMQRPGDTVSLREQDTASRDSWALFSKMPQHSCFLVTQ